MRPGEVIANPTLAHLQDGEVVARPLHDWLRRKTVVLVGLVGAFTPICTRHHLPSIIETKQQLYDSGVDRIICIAPSDPWSMQAWQDSMPDCKDMLFLSDGNQHLVRAMAMTTRCEALFLGTCSRRWLAVLRDARIARFTVESSILDVSCTAGASAALPTDDDDRAVALI